MNVIQHAYGGQSSRDIVLQILHRQDELIFRVIDFAQPVDKRALRARELGELRPGGLGLYIIEQIMDTVHFMPTPPGVGNILEMRKRLAAPDA